MTSERPRAPGRDADRDAARARLALGLAFAGVTAAVAYVVERLYERAQGSPVSPLLIVYDPRVGFHYRVLVATWFAGVGLAAGLALGRTERGREQLTRALSIGALPLVLVLALAAYVWP